MDAMEVEMCQLTETLDAVQSKHITLNQAFSPRRQKIGTLSGAHQLFKKVYISIERVVVLACCLNH